MYVSFFLFFKVDHLAPVVTKPNVSNVPIVRIFKTRSVVEYKMARLGMYSRHLTEDDVEKIGESTKNLINPTQVQVREH